MARTEDEQRYLDYMFRLEALMIEFKEVGNTALVGGMVSTICNLAVDQPSLLGTTAHACIGMLEARGHSFDA